MTTREIIHNKEMSRFILPLDNGDKAYVDYTSVDGVMHLVHSQVPLQLRGQGIGKELVEKTFDHIINKGEKAKAICSYIRLVALRNDKWGEIIT